jgi:hypothetical protein
MDDNERMVNRLCSLGMPQQVAWRLHVLYKIFCGVYAQVSRELDSAEGYIEDTLVLKTRMLVFARAKYGESK